MLKRRRRRKEREEGERIREGRWKERGEGKRDRKGEGGREFLRLGSGLAVGQEAEIAGRRHSIFQGTHTT